MPVLKLEKWEAYCQHIASGLTVEQAVKLAGFSPNGASAAGARLNRDPRIQARITELRVTVLKELEASTTPANLQARKYVRQQVQDRAYRIAVIQDNLDRLRMIVDERAEAYKDVKPGGRSGLLVRTVRTVGAGKNAREIEEYAIDKVALSEMREHLRHAAIELGEWAEDAPPPALPEPDADLADRTTEELFAEQAILNKAIEEIEAMRAGRKPLEIEGSVTQVEEEVPGRSEPLTDETDETTLKTPRTML